jgi:site-specific recombinase XerD
MERVHPTPQLADALQDYRETYMAFRNLAPRTRVEYGRDLNDVVKFLIDSCHLGDPRSVELKHLEHYLAELDRRGLSGASRRRKTAAIRSFFSFLEGHDYVARNVALRLRPPEREEKEPRVLTEAEFRRLQDACRFHPRDQAIIELFLQTGMRLSELARLTLADLDLPARVGREKGNVGSVHILGKGRKDRTVTLNWKVCRAVKSYLSLRPRVAHSALFVSKFGAPMGPRAIQDLVKKYFREASIANASVHTLRHTFGTHQVRKGTNLRVVQEAMGHTDLKATSTYVHLARDLMDEQLQANAL